MPKSPRLPATCVFGTPLRRRARGPGRRSGAYCRIPGNVENFPILTLIYMNGVAGGIGYLQQKSTVPGLES
eukprot:6503117-Pyramimonas_sp.AAC.1